MQVVHNLTLIYSGQSRDDVDESTYNVVLDGNVTEIMAEAFYESEHLELVDLKGGLTSTSDDWVKPMNGPPELRIIGTAAFYNCRKLQHITPFPQSLREIRNHAFFECRMLQSVCLPEGLREIGYAAFFQCWSLKELIIPSSVQEIQDSAFVGCRGLTFIDLPEGLPRIREQTFAQCSSLTRIKIPSTVKLIEDRAFDECSMLYSIELPEDVEIKGFEVFGHCENLTNIYIDGKSPFLSFEGDTPQTELFERCNKLYEQYSNDDEFEESLQSRFKGLPIHRLCYFEANKSHVWNIDSLGRSLFRGAEHYYDTVDKQDTFGMTPLHILTLSAKPNLNLIQDLVERYPESLRKKDRWGRYPIFYALLNRNSPETKCLNRYLLEMTVEKEVQSLGLKQWRSNIHKSLDKFLEDMDVKQKFDQLPKVIRKLQSFEMKEVISLLELALWKAKWDESKSSTNFVTKGNRRKRAKRGHDKTSCRLLCGAQVIIPNVLPFLKDNGSFQGLTCVNGSNFYHF